MLMTNEARPVSNRAEKILNSLPQPMMVLRVDRHLAFANPRAEALFERRHAQRSAGRLTQLGQLDGWRLADLLRQTLGGQSADVALWFCPDLLTGWLQLGVLAPELAQTGEWAPGHLLLTLHLDQPRLSQGARIEALCQRCRISTTERYVLMLLADGLVVESVARQLDLQVSTLRTHVRHLLGKTQATSLMQLLCWLGSAAPMPR